jgi:hypothetical protein
MNIQLAHGITHIVFNVWVRYHLEITVRKELTPKTGLSPHSNDPDSEWEK